MNDLLIAIIYGIIQGVGEFLPISSSGHLVLLHDFLPLRVGNEIAFDVFLHAGTLLAVVFYFWADLFLIIKSFFNDDKERRKLGIFLLLATIPAALAGYFFDDLITALFRSSLVVAIMLVLIGFLLIYSEKKGSGRLILSDLKWPQALIIGLSQALALIPGTSRSGITIVAGLFLGLKKTDAARFSFLLSIPIIAGAAATQLGELSAIGSDNPETAIYLSAFIAAVISGFLAIKFFLKFLSNHSLRAFAYYRFGLAAAIIAISFFLTRNS